MCVSCLGYMCSLWCKHDPTRLKCTALHWSASMHAHVYTSVSGTLAHRPPFPTRPLVRETLILSISHSPPLPPRANALARAVVSDFDRCSTFRSVHSLASSSPTSISAPSSSIWCSGFRFGLQSPSPLACSTSKFYICSSL